MNETVLLSMFRAIIYLAIVGKITSPRTNERTKRTRRFDDASSTVRASKLLTRGLCPLLSTKIIIAASLRSASTFQFSEDSRQ